MQDIFIKTLQLKLVFNMLSHGDFNDNDLTRRTASYKVLCDKTFNIAKNL